MGETMRPKLTPDLASRFARIALGHVEREYPNYLMHALERPEDARTPRDLHPIFFGSFDWHSCVHGYWMLARLLARFPDLPEAAAIRALFNRRITPEAVAGECAYLERTIARGFERPYGWAWCLKLATELHDVGPAWALTFSPLADVFADRFTAFLPKATYPVRTGTHYNFAFALALAADFARAREDDLLLGLLWQKAVDWFGHDRDCQAWEPEGDAFLSPALMEAECMRRLLPSAAWLPWFDAFLPKIAEEEPATLFRPASVSDRSDGKIAHLDGLNLSRAWCWRGIAGALPEGDPRRARAEASADLHLAAGLDNVAGDYMGEHWLASFAVLALES